MTLESKIEAILFHKAEPLTVKELAKMLSCPTEDILSSVEKLEVSYVDRGITLVVKRDEKPGDTEVMLGTSPAASELIENIIREELSRDLGKAGLETLAIILYKGPINRADIDYIRGVNSSFIIRNLLVRGLVERVTNPNDARSYIYKATMELFSLLGLTRIEDLPEFDTFKEKIDTFISDQKEEQDNAPEQPTITSEQV